MKELLAKAWDRFIDWWNEYAENAQKEAARNPDIGGPSIEETEEAVAEAINEITEEITHSAAVKAYLQKKWRLLNNPDEACGAE